MLPSIRRASSARSIAMSAGCVNSHSVRQRRWDSSNPSNRQTALLTCRKRPSNATSAMPAGANSNALRNRSSLLRSACSASRRLLTSRNTMTAPNTSPFSLRIGAAESSTESCVPLRPARIEPNAMLTTLSSRSARSTGDSILVPLCRSRSTNTSLTSWPATSWICQPIASSAWGFMKRIRLLASVATTPSPTQRSVEANHCSDSRRRVSSWALQSATSMAARRSFDWNGLVT